VVNAQYKVIRLSLQTDPETWEQRLNDAAAEGFVWVQAIAGVDGDTFVVLHRIPSGQGRIVPL
jgi:hypothetical protein